MRSFRATASRFLFPVLLLIIIIGFYWKLVLTNQFTWLEHPDAAYQVLPWLQMQAKAWHEGVFPAWDPYLAGGQPLVGQVLPGAVYPLNWILFLLPLRDGHIRLNFLHWYFVWIHFMAAAFCYWLCRDLKRSRAASLVAGLAFGLGGAMGAIDWPQMLNGALWAPLVVMFQLRAIRGRRPWQPVAEVRIPDEASLADARGSADSMRYRAATVRERVTSTFAPGPWTSAAFSGVCLGLSWLSGHHQIPTFVSLAVAGIWLLAIFRKGRPAWSTARLACVGLLFTALTGAMQILPAIEYGRLSVRWATLGEPIGWREPVPYTVHREYSTNPVTLIGIVIPGVFQHTNPYVGFVIGALAALAVAARWRDGRVRLFGLISLAGIFMALGSNSLIHGLLYAVVPMVEKARSPSMALAVFNFGVAVLAAYGLDSLPLRRAAAWRARISLALAAAGGLILLGSLAFITANKMNFDFDQRVVLAGFFALLAAALLQGVRRHGAFAACAAVLALMELANCAGFAFAHRLEAHRAVFLRELWTNADILAFLKRQPGPFRFEVDDKEIPYNWGDWQAMDGYNGFTASVPAAFWRLEPHQLRTRMLFGVRYSIRRAPDTQGQRQVFQGVSGLNVYENPQAFPRVWTVHDDPSAAAADDVRLIERGLNHLVIHANMATRGMVVLGDNWFPGWRATVDGAPVEIHAAYSALRGVVVERGGHRIQMRYRPLSLIFGALLTALGLAGAAGLAWWERRAG